MEIERKWLLRTLPMVLPDEKYWIEQFYLSLEPEVRLRRCVPNGDYENRVPYRMTVKGNGSLSRVEIQTSVEEDFYNQALDFVNLDPIEKHLLIYEKDGYRIEVAIVLEDANKGRTGFTYAEVEFDSEEDALAYKFPWPNVVIEEVTDKPEWKMKNYWQRTRLNS